MCLSYEDNQILDLVDKAREALNLLPSLYQAQTHLYDRVNICKYGSKNWNKWHEREIELNKKIRYYF